MTTTNEKYLSNLIGVKGQLQAWADELVEKKGLIVAISRKAPSAMLQII